MADIFRDAGIDVLLAEFARSGVRELHLRHGNFEIHLSNDASAPALLVQRAPAVAATRTARPDAVAAPVRQAAELSSRAAPDLPADAIVVKAPNLGTFYRAPKPGAAPYVEIGTVVQPGDELCLIEVMKLFTTVQAETAGQIHAILAEDGSMVEAGQALFAMVGE